MAFDALLWRTSLNWEEASLSPMGWTSGRQNIVVGEREIPGQPAGLRHRDA